MTTKIWEPDTTLRHGSSPGVLEADTGVLRATIAGYHLGRPTVVVRTPGGHRVTLQSAELHWRMADGKTEQIAVPTAPTEVDLEERGRVYAAGALNVCDDEYQVRPDRLKHSLVLPQLTVPDGATHLVWVHRAHLLACAPATLSGRTAGDLKLYGVPASSPEAVLPLARAEVEDAEGNRTHAVYEWYTPERYDHETQQMVPDLRRLDVSMVIDADWLRAAPLGEVVIDPTVVSTSYVWKSRPVRLSTGRIVQGIATSSGVVIKVSDDYGQTWQALTTPTGGIIDTRTNGEIEMDADADDRVHVIIGTHSSVQNPLDYHLLTITGLNATDVKTQIEPAAGTNNTWRNREVIVYSGAAGATKNIILVYGNIPTDVTGTQYLYARSATVTTAGVLTLGTRYTIDSYNEGGTRFLSGASRRADGTVKLAYQRYANGGASAKVAVATLTAPMTTTPPQSTILTGWYYADSMVPIDGLNTCMWVSSSGTNEYIWREGLTDYWKTASSASTGLVADTIAAVGDQANNRILLIGRESSTNYLRLVSVDYTSGSVSPISTFGTEAAASWPVVARTWDGVRIPVVYPSGAEIHSQTYSFNSPPQAPTSLTRVPFDATQPALFTWQHVDPDGNAQGSYQLQIYRVSDNVKVYDSGKTASGTQSLTLAANTLSNGVQYQWRVMTWDTSDAASPWSAYATVSTSGTGTATITNPAANGDTVNVSSLLARGSFSSPNDAGISAWRWWLTDPTGAVVYWDPGTVTSSAAPQQTIGYTLVHNTSYRLVLQVWDGLGIAAALAVRTFSVSLTPPTQPGFAATPNHTGGYTRIQFATQGADVATNDVYRRIAGGAWTRIATGVSPNGYYDDFTAPSGVACEYQGDAVGTNGVARASDVVTATLNLTGAWIHDVPGRARMVHLTREVGRGQDLSVDVSFLKFAGRRRPVPAFSETTDGAYHMQFVIQDWATVLALRALVESMSVVCVRDNSGRQVFGVLPSLPVEDQLGGHWTVSLDVAEVDYSEAV